MTMKYRLDRRAALGLLGGSAASVLIPVPGARVNAQTLDKVSYQTNWRAQTEHGGFYLAAANGIYKKYGLDVDIRPGGPQQNPNLDEIDLAQLLPADDRDDREEEPRPPGTQERESARDLARGRAGGRLLGKRCRHRGNNRVASHHKSVPRARPAVWARRGGGRRVR